MNESFFQRLRSITRLKGSLRIELWRRRYEAMKFLKICHPQTKLPRSRSQSPGNNLTKSHSLEHEHLLLVALQLSVCLSKGSELSSSSAAKATVLGQILTKKRKTISSKLLHTFVTSQVAGREARKWLMTTMLIWLVQST